VAVVSREPHETVAGHDVDVAASFSGGTTTTTWTGVLLSSFYSWLAGQIEWKDL